MALTTSGLHHVTAIAGEPQRNAAFYVDTLGLRFVKRTVNHDDPKTYHFYFGDAEGTPGTNITFFPWGDGGREGQFGAGQAKTVAYLIRPDSLDYWRDRLETAGIAVDQTQRFDETVLQFTDPDGIGLELVASVTEIGAATPWDESSVPAEHQLRGFHGVTLAVTDIAPTASVLADVLGYEREDETAERHRYRAEDGGPASVVDLVEVDTDRGRMGVGTVHHVAYKAASLEEQKRWQEAFMDHGLNVTEVIDRKYFRSIYSREPGGVLFEVATTGPGFIVDENADELGGRLTLPDWLEDERDEIEDRLPSFDPTAIGPGSDETESQ